MALLTPIYKVGPTIKMSDTKNAVNEVVVNHNSTEETPEHLQDVYEKGCENLDAEQMKKLREFILRKQHCFAIHGEVGRTNLGHHKINLHNEKPIKEPPRRIPLHKRQSLKEEVKNLEKVFSDSHRSEESTVMENVR